MARGTRTQLLKEAVAGSREGVARLSSGERNSASVAEHVHRRVNHVMLALMSSEVGGWHENDRDTR